MTCRIAEEMDLLAFASDRRAQEWDSFRDHYPSCPECTQAVSEIDELGATLRESVTGSESGHLAEEDLFSFSEGLLSGATLNRVETHLEGCASCRTEAAVLNDFAAEVAISLPQPSAAPVASDWIGQLRERLSRLLQPAPIWGLAASIALVVLVYSYLQGNEAEPEAPSYVEKEAPKETRPAPPEDPSVLPETGEQMESLLAEEQTPSPQLEENKVPNSPNQVRPTPSPQQNIAPETIAENPSIPRSMSPADSPLMPNPTPNMMPEQEIILLAAHFPSDLPGYSRPTGTGFEGLDPIRIGGVVRGANTLGISINVLAPKRVGATAQASPRLFWTLDRKTTFPIEIIISDPQQDEPLLIKRLPGPFTAGMHSIDLALEGVQLRENVTYDWSVSLSSASASYAQEVVSMGGIRRVRAHAPPTQESAIQVQAREVHRLAEAGYWYDAFDQINRWIEAAPDSNRLREYRTALLSQVGLDLN